MRRFNILLLFVALVIAALAYMYRNLNRSHVSFFGVAENQETQINLEHASTVNLIHVTEGEFVSKGKLLLEVTRRDLDFKLSELSHDISELAARDRLRREQILGDLDRSRAMRAEKAGEIQARIRLLESQQLLNQTLFSDLKSISTAITDSSLVYETKLKSLREELRLAIEPIDAQIASLEKELRLTSIPVQTESSKLQKAIELYQKEQALLRIYAPADGLVGSIHCQPGENIPAFNTLISFYEQSPNTVVAYLHESLSLQLKVGDSLRVQSTLHPAEQCIGVVSGLGHRIVEIPERLRKIPEIKTYGREVLIRIPPENHFLQKEKVMLQDPAQTGFTFLVIPPFSFRTNPW